MATSTINFGPVLKAQDNPWGLVYEQAITENVPGKVNIHPTTYNLDGIEIAANVYTLRRITIQMENNILQLSSLIPTVAPRSRSQGCSHNGWPKKAI